MSKTSEDLELGAIYGAYKEASSRAVFSQDRCKKWLDFLSQPDIAHLPVSWSGVESPEGSLSWGANVTFASLMNQSKKVYLAMGESDAISEITSSRLQDYAIGLHEDKKIIDEAQTSELISLFQDKNSLKFFLENYQEMGEKSLAPTKPKEMLKLKPLVSPEVFLIEAGGATKYDGVLTPDGVQKLRGHFEQACGLGLERATSIVKNASENLGKSLEGKRVLAKLEKDSEFLSIFDKKKYEGIWANFEFFYNQETQFGTKGMSVESKNLVNRMLNNLVEDIQIDCIGKFSGAMKTEGVQKKAKVVEELGVGM